MVVLVVILNMIPLGVAGDNLESWETYETTWLEYNYYNKTTIHIKHPISGSLVSDNQRLNFIIIPFDIDDYLYEIKIYKNDNLMYTINHEKVYDVNIFTSDAINQVVTIDILLDDVVILSLEYLAILGEPSLDRDFTDQWLLYQEEKINGSLTGANAISKRDQAIREMNLVASVGFWSLLFCGIAIFFVLLFQIIKVANLFSGLVWFGSGFLWLSSMITLDKQLTNIAIVTPDDVFIYYAGVITMTLVILIANLLYIIVYKATSTRLVRKDFYAIDKKNRVLTKYESVQGKQRGTGKPVWRLQDSFSAIRRVLFKADYVIGHDDIGDMNDTYLIKDAKEVPENISSYKPAKAMYKAMKEMNKRKIKTNSEKLFYAKVIEKDPEIAVMSNEGTLLTGTCVNCGDPLTGRQKLYCKDTCGFEYRLKQKDNPDKTENEKDLGTTLEPASDTEEPVEFIPNPIPLDDEREKDNAQNFDIWTVSEDKNPFSPQVPIVFLDGYPEFKEDTEPEKYDQLIEQMKKELADATDPKIVKSIRKRIKKMEGNRKKPVGYKVDVQLANRHLYDLLGWLTDCKYFDRMAKRIDVLWNRNHDLEIGMKLKSTDMAGEVLRRWEEATKEYQVNQTINEGE